MHTVTRGQRTRLFGSLRQAFYSRLNAFSYADFCSLRRQEWNEVSKCMVLAALGFIEARRKEPASQGFWVLDCVCLNGQKLRLRIAEPLGRWDVVAARKIAAHELRVVNGPSQPRLVWVEKSEGGESEVESHVL